MIGKNRFFDFFRPSGGEETPLVSSIRAIMTQIGILEFMSFLSPFIAEIDNDWQMTFEYLDHNDYEIDEENKRILFSTYGLEVKQALKSPYFSPKIILSMVEALRVIRHAEWLDSSLMHYHPWSIVQIGRICMADIATQLLSFAWVIREEGYRDTWKTLLCSDYADMAVIYQTIIEKKLSDIDMVVLRGIALAETFKQWFAKDERVAECDHSTLDLIDSMLLEQERPDQDCFNEYLKAMTVICLTLRAGGISSYVDTKMRTDILDNPYYSSISDPINHTHLKQIIRDLDTISIGNIAFRDKELAARFAALQ